jgi:hypothetical protein
VTKKRCRQITGFKLVEQSLTSGSQLTQELLDIEVTKIHSHALRLYARGEQPTQKYKDELSINGDLSYLNLDWKPVPILSKFIDIVVNGIADRTFDLKAYSQDPYGVSKRTKYLESVIRDLQTAELK